MMFGMKVILCLIVINFYLVGSLSNSIYLLYIYLVVKTICLNTFEFIKNKIIIKILIIFVNNIIKNKYNY